MELEIDGGLCNIELDKKALKELSTQSTGNITINISPATRLSNSAKKLIDNRKVYNITISYIKNKKTKYITNLNGGTIIFSVPYTLGKNEDAKKLFGVYINRNGKAYQVKDSYYDTTSQKIIIKSNRLSTYGIGY